MLVTNLICSIDQANNKNIKKNENGTLMDFEVDADVPVVQSPQQSLLEPFPALAPSPFLAAQPSLAERHSQQSLAIPPITEDVLSSASIQKRRERHRVRKARQNRHQEYESEAARRKHVRWTSSRRCIQGAEKKLFDTYVQSALVEHAAPGITISDEATFALSDALELFAEQWMKDALQVARLETKNPTNDTAILRPRHLQAARTYFKLNKLGPDEHFFHPDFTSTRTDLVSKPPGTTCTCPTCSQSV